MYKYIVSVTRIGLHSSSGFFVDSPDGQVVAMARLVMCSLDMPAKAMVFNMKQFNSECSYCEDKGETRSTSHLHCTWPYSTSSTIRTHVGILKNLWQPMHLYVYMYLFSSMFQLVLFV